MPSDYSDPGRRTMPEVLLKRFEQPDEVREMAQGRFEIVRLPGITIGRATYQPGWRWSEHVGPLVGATRCTVEHVGLVLAGVATVAFENRVIGHFLGAEHYAAK